MSAPVDELFGAPGAAPRERNRLGGLVPMLVVSLAVSFLCPLLLAWETARVALLGGPDWGAAVILLTVPAALGVLWVWQRADEERERSVAAEDDSGRIRAGRLRRLAYLGLVYCLVAMIVQTWIVGRMLVESGAGAG